MNNNQFLPGSLKKTGDFVPEYIVIMSLSGSVCHAGRGGVLLSESKHNRYIKELNPLESEHVKSLFQNYHGV